MYRFINGQPAYDLFNNSAFSITLFCCLFFLGAKLKLPGIFARSFEKLAPNKSKVLGKLVFVLLVALEFYISARQVLSTSVGTGILGNLLNTGANYFGIILLLPIATLAVSTVFVVDPLKNSDILTMLYPIFLVIIKLACFFNGCCWGIPWEYGPYNYHYLHPGKQVPVQALEILCAVVIFVFLLIYRRKAKPGKLLPMYTILYSATRFPIEFLSGAHEKIVGPFNTYHFLCIAGILYGIIMLLIVKYLGEKISAFYEKLYQKIDSKIATIQEAKAQKLSEENSKREAEMLERLEKAKKARAKASVKYKKK